MQISGVLKLRAKSNYKITEATKLSRRLRFIGSMEDAKVLLDQQEARDFRDECIALGVPIPDFIVNSLADKRRYGPKMKRWTQADYSELFEVNETRITMKIRLQEEGVPDPYGKTMAHIAAKCTIAGQHYSESTWKRLFTLLWPKGDW